MGNIKFVMDRDRQNQQSVSAYIDEAGFFQLRVDGLKVLTISTGGAMTIRENNDLWLYQVFSKVNQKRVFDKPKPLEVD